MSDQKNSENRCLGIYSFADGIIYCDTGMGPVPISNPVCEPRWLNPQEHTICIHRVTGQITIERKSVS